jgi:hypothetical protein
MPATLKATGKFGAQPAQPSRPPPKLMACPSGEAITLFFSITMRYGAGLTPGARYFLSGTVTGGLADAASTGGTAPVAFAVDATRIYVYQSRY